MQVTASQNCPALRSSHKAFMQLHQTISKMYELKHERKVKTKKEPKTLWEQMPKTANK